MRDSYLSGVLPTPAFIPIARFLPNGREPAKCPAAREKQFTPVFRAEIAERTGPEPSTAHGINFGSQRLGLDSS